MQMIMLPTKNPSNPTPTLASRWYHSIDPVFDLAPKSSALGNVYGELFLC